MNYCSNCGSVVHLQKPDGDERLRHVCNQCATIHYQNPKIIAGCIPVSGEKVLLCKRAIEPRYGTWTLPAGFMEMNETLEDAALRESMEEANVHLNVNGLFAIFNLPHISQVHVYFRSSMLNDHYSPGTESLEVALFEERDIPWDDISFLTVEICLRMYFEDREQGIFPIHVKDIRI